MRDATMAYLDRTYDEAKSLLAEARIYLRCQEQAGGDRKSDLEGLRAVGEGLRLTTRLTEVLAWSMIQQALRCGEITREEASEPRRRLGSRKICLEQDPLPGDGELPPKLASLLQRSRALYERTLRLDRLAAGEEMQFGSFNVCLVAPLPAAPHEAAPLARRPQILQA
jgi:regulator of CtrA degradation